MEEKNSIIIWGRYALFNLVLVALLGILLRYKIIFSIPFVNQKHLLDGHFHFAFLGWATQMILTLLISILPIVNSKQLFRKYIFILRTNIFISYGLLISFIAEGYGFFSILFLISAIILFYIFGFIYWKDLNKINEKGISHLYFKAAIIFNAISSFGIISLVYLMSQKIIHQNWYLISAYFFLHFQYNGLFIFSCFGLFLHILFSNSIYFKNQKLIFWIFCVSLPPTYLLSTLWMKMSWWILMIVVGCSIVQCFNWLWLCVNIWRKRKLLSKIFSRIVLILLSMSGLALTIKFILQVVSTFPSLSQYAFGFRPVVIGYLHLVFLGVITMFLLAYSFYKGFIHINPFTQKGIAVFIVGVIINEVMLMIQGLSFMNYILLPYSNEILFIIVFIIFIGTLLLISTRRNNLK